jgi:uncharacterized protein
MLLFEWDPNKAKENLAIHGISFDEASTAFRDTLSLAIYDPLHSEEEDRVALIGNSHTARLLVVVHTERGDNIRLIRKQYEENAKRSGNA